MNLYRYCHIQAESNDQFTHDLSQANDRIHSLEIQTTVLRGQVSSAEERVQALEEAATAHQVSAETEAQRSSLSHATTRELQQRLAEANDENLKLEDENANLKRSLLEAETKALSSARVIKSLKADLKLQPASVPRESGCM